MAKIVIIDQDDTLWNFLDAHIASYERMFPYIFGFPYIFENGPGVGGTTRLSIKRVLEQKGLGNGDITSKIEQAEEFMAGVVREELRTGKGGQPFEGSRDFLYELLRNGCVVVTGTGTSRVISQEILKFTGLDIYFEAGAYGCEREDRTAVFRLALQRGIALVGRTIDPRFDSVYVVDDSVKGIQAARDIGAKVLSVRSGVQRDQLAEHNPDAVFESVAEYQRMIEFILNN